MMTRRKHSRTHTNSQTTIVVYSLLITAVFGSIILTGGGQNPLSLSLFIIATGTGLLLAPPRNSPARFVHVSVILLLLGMLIQYIPLPSFIHSNWWHSAQEIGLDLSYATAIQPFVQLEHNFIILIFVLCLYTLTDIIRSKDLKLPLLKCLSGAITLLAIGFIYGNQHKITYPFAEASHSFSYFPNSNQSVLMLATGAIIALGLLIREYKRSIIGFIFHSIQYIICTVAVLEGSARSGLILLAIGSICVLFSNRHRADSKLIAIIGSAIITGIFFLFSLKDSYAIERIHALLRLEEGSLGARSQIYPDAIHMLFDQLGSGSGLGNFRYIFPHYWNHFDTPYVAIHPESDLLWFSNELGLLGLCIIAVAAMGLLKHIYFRLNTKKRRSTAIIAKAALLIILLHAIVDVPLHRPGTYMLACLLFAIALPHKSNHTLPVKPLYLRVCGIITILIGIYFLYSSYNDKGIGYTQYAKHAQSNALKYNKNADYDSLMQLSKQWAERIPLDWRAYYYQGICQIQNHNIAAAEKQMNRAKFLAPYKHDLFYHIGLLWADLAPEKIPDNWIQSIRLSPSSNFSGMSGLDNIFERMQKGADVNTHLRIALNETTKQIRDDYPRLRILFLERISDKDLQAEWVAEELLQDITKPTLETKYREKLLLLLIESQKIDTFKAIYQKFSHDDKALLWFPNAKLLANERRFSSAIKLALIHLPEASLPSIGDTSDHSPIIKYANLYTESIHQKQWSRTLDLAESLKTHLKQTTSYILYWNAVAYMHLNLHQESWISLEKYKKKVNFP